MGGTGNAIIGHHNQLGRQLHNGNHSNLQTFGLFANFHQLPNFSSGTNSTWAPNQATSAHLAGHSVSPSYLGYAPEWNVSSSIATGWEPPGAVTANGASNSPISANSPWTPCQPFSTPHTQPSISANNTNFQAASNFGQPPLLPSVPDPSSLRGPAIPGPGYSPPSAPNLHASALSAPPATRSRQKGPRSRQKNYICRMKDCGFAAESQSHVDRHTREVHHKIQVTCPVCRKRLSSRGSNLRRHQDTPKCRNHLLRAQGFSPSTRR